jgi:hypothetical protein
VNELCHRRMGFLWMKRCRNCVWTTTSLFKQNDIPQVNQMVVEFVA